MVADNGAVVLFDQFDTVRGSIAVLLIDPQGPDVVKLTFDDIASAIGATESDIFHQDRHGTAPGSRRSPG